MTLNNWRGQSTEVIFGKNITDIYGRNKTGKSTLFNAFYWVFTGFDIKGRANYQLFDNRLPLTYENAIPAEVHIVTEIDGNEYKFSRIAIQSWSRKRGESEYTKNRNNIKLSITHHFYSQVGLYTTLKFPTLRNGWYNEGVMQGWDNF